MKTKNVHSAMSFLCAVHVMQGVFDDCKGTAVFNHKSEKLIGQLLRTYEPYFERVLKEEGAQLQFNNLGNAIELMGQWLCDNHGTDLESADQMANKIASLYKLMGFEVEQVS